MNRMTAYSNANAFLAPHPKCNFCCGSKGSLFSPMLSSCPSLYEVRHYLPASASNTMLSPQPSSRISLASDILQKPMIGFCIEPKRRVDRTPFSLYDTTAKPTESAMSAASTLDAADDSTTDSGIGPSMRQQKDIIARLREDKIKRARSASKAFQQKEELQDRIKSLETQLAAKENECQLLQSMWDCKSTVKTRPKLFGHRQLSVSSLVPVSPAVKSRRGLTGHRSSSVNSLLVSPQRRSNTRREDRSSSMNMLKLPASLNENPTQLTPKARNNTTWLEQLEASLSSITESTDLDFSHSESTECNWITCVRNDIRCSTMQHPYS